MIRLDKTESLKYVYPPIHLNLLSSPHLPSRFHPQIFKRLSNTVPRERFPQGNVVNMTFKISFSWKSC